MKSNPGPNRRLQLGNAAKEKKSFYLFGMKRKATLTLYSKSGARKRKDFVVFEEAEVLQKSNRGQRVVLKERVRFKTNTRNWMMTSTLTANRRPRPGRTQ